MFEAYSISTASSNPPDLRPILEDSSKSDELSLDAAMRYRAALGKLSRMSQTYVSINVYIALLATGMATPQYRHEKAMRSVLKFMKSQEGIYQRFPSPEATIEEQEAQRLVIYCDATLSMRIPCISLFGRNRNLNPSPITCYKHMLPQQSMNTSLLSAKSSSLFDFTWYHVKSYPHA